MTPARIFDAYFSEDGGYARLSGHAAEDRFDERRRAYRRFLSDCCAQLAQQNVTLNVYFDFVDSPEINAAAGRVGDLYLLGVNYGTLAGARWSGPSAREPPEPFWSQSLESTGGGVS